MRFFMCSYVFVTDIDAIAWTPSFSGMNNFLTDRRIIFYSAVRKKHGQTAKLHSDGANKNSFTFYMTAINMHFSILPRYLFFW